MTRKLYYEDACIQNFAAKVVSCEQQGNTWAVVLDQTAFFPEEGGQSADTGLLGPVHVQDVREHDGVITHYTDGPLITGGMVFGSLDWPERWRKMQTHSGEHIVSGLVHRAFGYNNVGFHLSECGCTVDYNGELTRLQLDELENRANKIVWEDRKVTAQFPPAEELKTLEYRSKRNLEKDVRIVSIEGVDTCACCAPHVRSTGQIGVIKLLDFMRHRGGVRIWMKAGSDALEDYRSRYTAAAAVSGLLNVPQNEIVSGVEKLLRARDALKKDLSDLRRERAQSQAAELECSPGNMVLFTDGDEEIMRIFANAGMERCAGVCAVFSGRDGEYRFVMASCSTDMRLFMKTNGPALGARGGGSSRMVSGKCSADRSTIEAYFSVNGKTL